MSEQQNIPLDERAAREMIAQMRISVGPDDHRSYREIVETMLQNPSSHETMGAILASSGVDIFNLPINESDTHV